MTHPADLPGFSGLGLTEPVLAALTAAGYEAPSPIQAATIPHLLAGLDVLGQAQTGTGKTAAFALPILSRINLQRAAAAPKALVLVPTRELAQQVTEAFRKYAAELPGFHVLAIYGGQSYTPQLKGLKRGAHVVVGTPGRVMDHVKSGALDLSALDCLVLDEGDEMLQMGFVDDIEWILSETPPTRQIALFSATLPAAIRRIAQKHMRDPKQITIASQAATAPNIRQHCWLVSGMHKLDALTRVLEVEPFDAMLVFVRTKLDTEDLAERLEARGFRAAALHGDMPQALREKTIAKLKAGGLDIVVATDVAARGLDVERVSHVVNYDIPYDAETYIHRIGRTGRAGRAGVAILFVAPRERNMLRIIERATHLRIEPMTLPGVEDVNARRVARFKERVQSALGREEAKVFRPLLEELASESGVPPIELAAALAGLLQGATPFLLAEKTAGRVDRPAWTPNARPARAETGAPKPTAPAAPARPQAGAPPAAAAKPPPVATKPPRLDAERQPRAPRASAHERRDAEGDGVAMETFRIEVGHAHGVLPGNVVGAIANEAGLEGRHIGRIDIREDHSFVDLPEGMPKEIFRELKKVKVRGVELRISRADRKPPRAAHAGRPPRGAFHPSEHRAGPPRAAARRGAPAMRGRPSPL